MAFGYLSTSEQWPPDAVNVLGQNATNLSGSEERPLETELWWKNLLLKMMGFMLKMMGFTLKIAYEQVRQTFSALQSHASAPALAQTPSDDSAEQAMYGLQVS